MVLFRSMIAGGLLIYEIPKVYRQQYISLTLLAVDTILCIDKVYKTIDKRKTY